MNFPISQEYINRILLEQDIDDISNATIRQCAGIAEKIEEDTGEKFVHLELGIPGVEECPIGTKAQKEALDSGVASKYPPISGVKALKQSGSEFIKAFINVDIKPECVVPTVGGMQGSYNLFLECSQMTPFKDTILFINPGFPANYTQIKVLGIKSVSFDIYSFRAEKLRPKLEEILSQGNVSAIIYSNPNNPAWICLTESELKDIGDCATKYDVIVLEDMAYLCMDFRQDLSKPNVPPFQPTVARYTDNYVLMISASKIFSYAGERIAIMAFSDKLFFREYPALKERYGIGRMGDNYVLTYLYCASSGVSHSAQYAFAKMLKESAEGRCDFVTEMSEYGRRAKHAKDIFEKHGFNIVYNTDLDKKLSDGFFFTIGYKNMSNKEILTRLLRSGVIAITLNTTGSLQNGIRVCVSQLNAEEDFTALDERLNVFVQLG